MTVAQGSKTVKKASAPKKSKTFIPSHPPYIQLVTEALVGLKERTGSSHYAIAKHIEEEQKVRDLPPNFRKVLSIQLKRFVASGRLVKIKNSFKLPPGAAKTAPVTAPAVDKPKPKRKPKAEEGAATKKDAAKPKGKTPTKKKEAAKSKGVSVKPKAKAAAPKPKPKKEKAEKPKSAPKKTAPAKEKKSKSVRSPVKKAPAAKKARK